MCDLFKLWFEQNQVVGHLLSYCTFPCRASHHDCFLQNLYLISFQQSLIKRSLPAFLFSQNNTLNIDRPFRLLYQSFLGLSYARVSLPVKPVFCALLDVQVLNCQ